MYIYICTSLPLSLSLYTNNNDSIYIYIYVLFIDLMSEGCATTYSRDASVRHRVRKSTLSKRALSE